MALAHNFKPSQFSITIRVNLFVSFVVSKAGIEVEDWIGPTKKLIDVRNHESRSIETKRSFAEKRQRRTQSIRCSVKKLWSEGRPISFSKESKLNLPRFVAFITGDESRIARILHCGESVSDKGFESCWNH